MAADLHKKANTFSVEPDQSGNSVKIYGRLYSRVRSVDVDKKTAKEQTEWFFGIRRLKEEYTLDSSLGKDTTYRRTQKEAFNGFRTKTTQYNAETGKKSEERKYLGGLFQTRFEYGTDGRVLSKSWSDPLGTVKDEWTPDGRRQTLLVTNASGRVQSRHEALLMPDGRAVKWRAMERRFGPFSMEIEPSAKGNGETKTRALGGLFKRRVEYNFETGRKKASYEGLFGIIKLSPDTQAMTPKELEKASTRERLREIVDDAWKKHEKSATAQSRDASTELAQTNGRSTKTNDSSVDSLTWALGPNDGASNSRVPASALWSETGRAFPSGSSFGTGLGSQAVAGFDERAWSSASSRRSDISSSYSSEDESDASDDEYEDSEDEPLIDARNSIRPVTASKRPTEGGGRGVPEIENDTDDDDVFVDAPVIPQADHGSNANLSRTKSVERRVPADKSLAFVEDIFANTKFNLSNSTSSLGSQRRTYSPSGSINNLRTRSRSSLGDSSASSGSDTSAGGSGRRRLGKSYTRDSGAPPLRVLRGGDHSDLSLKPQVSPQGIAENSASAARASIGNKSRPDSTRGL